MQIYANSITWRITHIQFFYLSQKKKKKKQNMYIVLSSGKILHQTTWFCKQRQVLRPIMKIVSNCFFSPFLIGSFWGRERGRGKVACKPQTWDSIMNIITTKLSLKHQLHLEWIYCTYHSYYCTICLLASLSLNTYKFIFWFRCKIFWK